MVTNLKVGKTNKAIANLTTPIAPRNPFAPWGDSPQAKRLLYLLSLSSPSLSYSAQMRAKLMMVFIARCIVVSEAYS